MHGSDDPRHKSQKAAGQIESRSLNFFTASETGEMVFAVDF